MPVSASWTSGARMFWPMNRFAEWITCVGSVSRNRLASPPTTTPPLDGNATTDGWMRSPREPSTNSTPVGVASAAHELVVPRSIPNAIPIQTNGIATRGSGLFGACVVLHRAEHVALRVLEEHQRADADDHRARERDRASGGEHGFLGRVDRV